MKRIVTLKMVLECSTLEDFENHIKPLLKDISAGVVQRDMTRKNIKVKCTYEIQNEHKETVWTGESPEEGVGAEGTD